jgi:hypothetical protein
MQFLTVPNILTILTVGATFLPHIAASESPSIPFPPPPADLNKSPLASFFEDCTAPCWKRYAFCNQDEYYASVRKKDRACQQRLMDCTIECLSAYHSGFPYWLENIRKE